MTTQSAPHSISPVDWPADLTDQTFLAEPFLQTLLPGSSQGMCKLLSSRGIRWPLYYLGSKFITEQRHLSAAASSTYQKKCQVSDKLLCGYQAISSSFINCPDWLGVGDRGWDGWMVSPTQWTWLWANSSRQWRTGKPGVLRSMGLQNRTWLSNGTTKTTTGLVNCMGGSKLLTTLNRFSEILDCFTTCSEWHPKLQRFWKK